MILEHTIITKTHPYRDYFQHQKLKISFEKKKKKKKKKKDIFFLFLLKTYIVGTR